jgi:hypothetical protein
MILAQATASMDVGRKKPVGLVISACRQPMSPSTGWFSLRSPLPPRQRMRSCLLSSPGFSR